MKNALLVSFLVAMLSVLSGCKGTARLVTDTKQVGSTLTVTVNVNPPTSGKLRFKGNAALEKLGDVEVKSDGKAVVDIPIGEGTSGKNTVTMTFDGVGRGLAKTVSATGDFTFDNVAVQTMKMRGDGGTGTTVPCKGGDFCSQDLIVTADAKAKVVLTDCDGCTLDVGGGQTIQLHGPSTNATIDLTNVLGAALTPDLATIKLPFKITTGDGRSTDVAIETSSAIMALVLGRVASGPLHFAGEAARGPTRAAAIVNAEPGLGIITHVGSAEHIRDNDLVGIATGSDKVVGTCAYVRKSDPTNTPVNLDHRIESYDVTMYDRRLGTKVGRRKFQPKDVSCNSSLEGTANATWSFPDIPEMTAWAKTFLK